MTIRIFILLRFVMAAISKPSGPRPRSQPHSCLVTGSPVEWVPHSTSYCTICDEKSKGGQPKKRLTSCGQPSLFQTHISSISCILPRFRLEQVVDTSYKGSITCSVCKSDIHNPIEVLPCKILVCASCILATLDKKMATFNCPGCSEEHNTDPSSFSRLSPVMEKMFLNMIVMCDNCCKKVKLLHITESCASHIHNDSDNTNTALTVAATQPMEANPTQHETQVATNVLSRLFHQTNSCIITLSSKHQVINLPYKLFHISIHSLINLFSL